MVTLDEIYDRLRRLEEKHKENMFEIEKRLVKTETTAKPSNLEERVNDLEDLLRLSELEMLKLGERISVGADATGIVPASLEARLENMEKNLSTTSGTLEGPEMADVSAKMDAFDERLGDIDENTRDKLNGINEKINEALSRVRDIKPADLHGLGKKMEQFKDLEERLDKELDKRRELIAKLNSVSNEADKFSATIASARAIEERIRNDIDNLNVGKEEAHRHVDNSLRQVKVIEEDVEQRMANAESMIRSAMEKLNHTQETLDAQMSRLDRRFSLMDSGGLSEETLKNMSRKLSEYQYKINQLSEQMNNMDVGRLEKKIENIAERIQNAEQRSDERSIRFLTEQLDAFAKAVDNKMPQLPSSSQFENVMRMIEQLDVKIMHIERPNVIPLERRVDVLAEKVDKVMDIIRRMSGRMPVVVD